MKILLTTDGSESAEQSIRWFSRLPIAHSPSYDVVTVSSYQAYGIVPVAVHDEFVRLESVHATDSFDRASAILHEAGLASVHLSRLGQPADVITDLAKESKADLIVVGAHGKSQLARMLIGSTSETIARYAPCSVLIVRDGPATKFDGNHFPLLTIASDGSDADTQIAAQINALGFPRHTKIQLVSVIEHPYLLEPSFEYDAHVTRETRMSMDRLAKQLESNHINVEKSIFEKVHVASCILDFTVRHASDIIVLGDKGRSAIGRFFLGSVSRSILHHAPCSVLLVRKRLE